MRLIIFLLGAVLIVSFFHVELLVAPLIFGIITLVGGLLQKKILQGIVLGAILACPYFINDLKIIVFILGIVFVLGAVFDKEETEEKPPEEAKQVCIERKVFGDLLILEVMEIEKEKVCILKGVSEMNMRDVKQYELYKTALYDALEDVHKRLKEDPDLKWLWYV